MKISEDRTKVWTVMLCDQNNIVTESWKKNGQNGAKSPGKNSEKMPEERMRCCKNYPQTGRIIQPQFVEIKPAKTYRKHRENCTHRSNFLERIFFPIRILATRCRKNAQSK